MFSFLSEFTRDVETPSTFIVMDADGLDQPRHYKVVPRNVLFLAGSVTAGLALVLLAVVVLTPVREFIPGYGTAEMRQDARLNVLRVQALQDSLSAQQRYLTQLRHLMLGEVDTSMMATRAPEPTSSAEGADVAPEFESSSDWADHRQPAILVERLGATGRMPFRLTDASPAHLPSVVLPALPPVEGFVTRGFDARTGHYAVDIAVDAGTVVRSVGDGYVVLADWTQEGGYAIAVQHADGYLSVYKHNERLYKRTGDRVRARDAIAESGNSGEITTGPHLHFELWHHGLAQDPGTYIIGL